MRALCLTILAILVPSVAHAWGVVEKDPTVWHAIQCVAQLNKAVEAGDVPPFTALAEAEAYGGDALTFWQSEADRLTKEWGTGYADEVGEEEFLIGVGEATALKSVFKDIKVVGTGNATKYVFEGGFFADAFAQSAVDLCMYEAEMLVKQRAQK